MRKPVLLLLGALAAVGLVSWSLFTPSHDRHWSTDQSVLPTVEFHGDSALIHGVRNFRWTSATAFEPAWEDRSYRLDQVATAWYVLVPFSKAWRGPAHAFVSFGFDDGRYLAVSVEARREVGETYGALKGLFRRFELIYVVGDERDLIGRRSVYDGTDVYLYPVKADRAGARAMLTGMLERVNQLHDRPEFYNTITNNCTLNLVHHVNQIVPGRIPSSWRIILPGYSDAVAQALGLIDSAGTLAEIRQRFRINDRARTALDSADFSRLIRQ
ncbi:MAG TPA: DUF4105 domain-containing protein [Gemmatimonadales bacterium]|nr:DUF4105 domain-containing protein [Gemmatimonadales bacterium]